MNLKKYTKAELISKINQYKIDRLEQKVNSNQVNFKNYLSQIWDLLINFKNILVKLTLISFFIQIFKKYRIIRRLWIIINSTIVSIFGISLIDNFGFDFLTNFLIGINPFNKEFYIIRIISVFVIILILYYNTNKIYFIASFILPLSIDKITFLNEMKVNIFIYTDTEESEIFYLFEVNETSEFLNRLDDDDNYVFLLNLWVIFQFLMKMLQKWFFRNLFW